MFNKFRKKLPVIAFGLLVLLFAAWIQLTNVTFIAGLREEMNVKAYDFMLNVGLPDFSKSSKYNVVIVDIDERSIQQVGRWPWPRKIVAKLVNELHQAGTAVVGFDITFTQPEANMAVVLLNEAKKDPTQNKDVIKFLENNVPNFDYDEELKKSFASIETVLGFVFHNDTSLTNSGQLPPPIFQLDQQGITSSLAFDMYRYRANIELLQNAAKHGGFVTIFPDDDGVLRRAPLVLRYQNALYPSLDLEVVRQYLLLDKVGIETEKVGKNQAIAAVKIGDIRIPTDEHGQIFIPYHKKINNRQIIPAVDLLNNKFDSNILKNSMVLVGSSALSLNDIHATPVDPVYPGLYLHGDILNSLLTGDFSSKPTWAPAAELIITIIVGLLCIFIFPFIDVLSIILIAALLISGIIIGNHWLLHHEKTILSVLLPVGSIGLITIFNLVYGLFFEVRQRAKLKSMFGQYVPSELVEVMNEDPKQYGFEGETKELTVLFSDIRSFTTISESLTVTQLKDLLNQFLTPITAVIFKYHGTIDKYVGDMVMAFWGAPVNNPTHATNALSCALEMLAITEELKLEFQMQGLPVVDIGVGLNTGLMNVGDMGSQFRRAYTVLGNAVNLASRLEGLSKQYGVKIVVGEDTWKNQPDFIFKKLDRVKVKGKTEASEIFALICKKIDATPDILAEISEYEKALNEYFAGHFEMALNLFLSLNKKYPSTTLYNLYIERIQNLIKQPLEGEWDGVYEWKIK